MDEEAVEDFVTSKKQGTVWGAYGPSKIGDYIIWEVWVHRRKEYATRYVVEPKEGSKRASYFSSFQTLATHLDRKIPRRRVSPGRVSNQSLEKRKQLTVLYLVADPDLDNPLRVNVEVRQVQDAIRGSAFRDKIKIEYRPAADLASLIRGLNDHRPQIVHFSGHGDKAGLATDNNDVARPAAKPLSYEHLANALKATDDPPQVVVLNSCNSSEAKPHLSETKVLVTMRVPVSDIAATVFASHFYAAIAGGQSVGAAFAQGKLAVEAISIGETATPDLLSKPGGEKLILT